MDNASADIYCRDIKLDIQGLSATVVSPWGEGKLQSPLIGQFNLANLLSVIATVGTRYPLSEVLSKLPMLKSPAGRMELINAEAKPGVIVDYAHTPDALEKVLITLRSHSRGKLWVVFGCGGERDIGKRSKMGAIAERYADYVVITNDNPRGESEEAIISHIKMGMMGKVVVEMDRRSAITSGGDEHRVPLHARPRARRQHMRLSLANAAAQFGGTLTNPDCQFSRVCIDTRKVNHGDLFVAIKGSTHDAHDYLDKIEREICGAVVSTFCPHRGVAQWVVQDTTIALGDLAKLRREFFDGPVIAITGSSGKTSVKEFVAAILKRCGKVHSTLGNYNNQIGVPLTLLSLPQSAKFLVVEMGANKIGDINYLCTIARPTISLINNIQSAHIEGFGSLEGTAAAKAEIYSGLSPQGTAVINLDLEYTEDWRVSAG